LNTADIDPLKDLLPVEIDGIGVKVNHSGYLSFPRQCLRCSQMLCHRLRWHIIRSSQFRENRS